MIKKIYNLFKILRKLSSSGAVEILDEIKPIPKILKFVFFIFSLGSSKKQDRLPAFSKDKAKKY